MAEAIGNRGGGNRQGPAGGFGGSGGRFRPGGNRPGGNQRGGGARPGGGRGWRDSRGAKAVEGDEAELIEKVIFVNRSSKVVKGGRRFNFSALVVVGNGSGKVGLGLGKAGEVANAIRKASDIARRSMEEISLMGNTIPHRVDTAYDGAIVMLRPASPGTGVIAGKVVRSLLESAGIKDVLTKSLGSNNATNVAKATLTALKSLRKKAEVFAARGLAVPEKASRVSEPAVAETASEPVAAEESSESAAVAEPATEPGAEPTVPAAVETPAPEPGTEPSVPAASEADAPEASPASAEAATESEPAPAPPEPATPELADEPAQNSNPAPPDAPAEPPKASDDGKLATEQ